MLAAMYKDKHHITVCYYLCLQQTFNMLSVTCDVNSRGEIQVYIFLMLAYSPINMPTVLYYMKNNLST